MADSPRVLIIEDHPMMRDVLAQTLRRCLDGAQVACAANLEHGIEEAAHLDSGDLVVLDLGLPGFTGLAALRALRTAVKWVRVLVFSASEEPPLIAQAKRMGAMGYVPKSSPPAQFAEAARAVLNGELAFPPTIDRRSPAGLLSPAEIELLCAMDRGEAGGTRSDLARTLGLTERVVKRRLSGIYAKLGVASRVEAVARARQLGAIPRA